MPVVVIPISGMPVDAASAPDQQMDVGVLIEPKPKVTRKPRAKKAEVIPDTTDTDSAEKNEGESDIPDPELVNEGAEKADQ